MCVLQDGVNMRHPIADPRFSREDANPKHNNIQSNFPENYIKIKNIGLGSAYPKFLYVNLPQPFPLPPLLIKDNIVYIFKMENKKLYYPIR